LNGATMKVDAKNSSASIITESSEVIDIYYNGLKIASKSFNVPIKVFPCSILSSSV
jgi:hypothetical protein